MIFVGAFRISQTASNDGCTYILLHNTQGLMNSFFIRHI